MSDFWDSDATADSGGDFWGSDATQAQSQTSAPAPQNSHDFVPFLKNTAQGIKSAADEFSSQPLPTIAYNHLVKPAVDAYQTARAGGANPINAGLDAAAAGTGAAAETAKSFVTPQMIPVEAYFRSRQNGNSAEDALKDARNVATLVWGPAAAAKVAGTATDLAGKVALKEAGVTPAQVATYRANPEAVNAAKPLFDQTKSFLSDIDDTSSDLSDSSSAAFKLLKDAGTADPANFSGPIRAEAQRLNGLGVFSPERKSGIAFLSTLADDVDKAGTIPGSDAGAAIQDFTGSESPATSDEPLPKEIGLDKGKAILNALDSQIERLGASPGADPQVLKSLGDARSAIDGYLKDTVPAYKDHMAQLAQQTQVYSDLADKFRTDQGAMNTLKRIQSGKDPFSAEALQSYDQQFGTTHGQDLQNAATKQAFAKQTTNGSRKAVTGGAIGSAIGSSAGGALAGTPGAVVGGAIGAATGAATGAMVDKYGGAAVKAALDAGIKIDRLAGTQYAEPIMRAAQQSPQRAAVAHYILATQDPAYQALMQGAGDKDNQNPPADQQAE